ncbi:MAG TPA: hypothetical protein VK474_03645, partial [Chthoniobacterales bacterium]|nr:hypothetical protein [Chthoniobacterales bacterium]
PVLVALLIGLLFAVTNLPWNLDNYDQAKQAFTPFEMVQTGHWLYQHTPNEMIATKPPLVGWISAAVFRLTGSWDAAWRLPSIAAAIALLIVLTRAAVQAYGATAGLLAMSACGLNLLSARLAALVRTDMPLGLVVFLIGLLIWQRVRAQDGRPQARTLRRERWFMFILLTAAMMIKGPIVYAFLLPGIIVFQWRYRGTQISAWCGWWPWVASLVLFLLWVAGGIIWAPGFYEQVVLHEFAGRFSESVHRSQPVYFYLPHLLHKFGPWSVLMIALGILWWKKSRVEGARGNGKTMRQILPRSPEIAWLLFWGLGGVVVMSLVPSKRVDRIFPVVPPLCLLLAAQFARCVARDDLVVRTRRWSGIALVLACLGTSAYAAGKIFDGFRSGDGALVQFGAAVRAETAAHGWRYEVIGGKEEGLLLYLRRPHFTSPDEAIALWNGGTLEALVAPAEEVPRLLSALHQAAPAGLEASITIKGQPCRYALLKKIPPPVSR